jgi:hypothetical protein
MLEISDKPFPLGQFAICSNLETQIVFWGGKVESGGCGLVVPSSLRKT